MSALNCHDSRDICVSSRACMFGHGAAAMAFGLSVAQCRRVWTKVCRWMQVGIWKLHLRCGEGGELAGSPAVLSGILADRCCPELRVRTVQLCCLTARLVHTPWILLLVV